MFLTPARASRRPTAARPSCSTWLATTAPPTLPDGFDGLQYIASYADLIAAFGANRTAGEQHYLDFGQGEGRAVDTFSETQYLRNYGDLGAAFGTNVDLATQHFITNGLGEGRNDDAASPSQIQACSTSPPTAT